jgi:hypothetical protein
MSGPSARAATSASTAAWPPRQSGRVAFSNSPRGEAVRRSPPEGMIRVVQTGTNRATLTTTPGRPLRHQVCFRAGQLTATICGSISVRTWRAQCAAVAQRGARSRTCETPSDVYFAQSAGRLARSSPTAHRHRSRLEATSCPVTATAGRSSLPVRAQGADRPVAADTPAQLAPTPHLPDARVLSQWGRLNTYGQSIHADDPFSILWSYQIWWLTLVVEFPTVEGDGAIDI